MNIEFVHQGELFYMAEERSARRRNRCGYNLRARSGSSGIGGHRVEVCRVALMVSSDDFETKEERP